MPDNSDAPRVIAALYVGWRPLRGQKMLRLEFEVPLEQQGEALSILGPPRPEDAPQYCAIAPLALDAPTATPEKARRHQGHPAVLEAVLACQDKRFQKYITWAIIGRGLPFSEETAVQSLYQLCGITSRRELGEETPLAIEARQKLRDFMEKYRNHYGVQ